jgi:hypothetical protein
VEKRRVSCSCQKLEPDRPARSSSLYRLSYPATNIHKVFTNVLDDTSDSEPVCNNTAQTKYLECRDTVSRQQRNGLAQQQKVRLECQKSLYRIPGEHYFHSNSAERGFLTNTRPVPQENAPTPFNETQKSITLSTRVRR